MQTMGLSPTFTGCTQSKVKKQIQQAQLRQELSKATQLEQETRVARIKANSEIQKQQQEATVGFYQHEIAKARLEKELTVALAKDKKTLNVQG
jgi:peptide subunit release factor RF-3